MDLKYMPFTNADNGENFFYIYLQNICRTRARQSPTSFSWERGWIVSKHPTRFPTIFQSRPASPDFLTPTIFPPFILLLIVAGNKPYPRPRKFLRQAQI